MFGRGGLGVALLAALCVALVLVPAAGAAARERPNVVVVMTDDQDFRSMEAMPRTAALMARTGTTFWPSIVNFPLCCPSRATFFTGQYAHNHGVLWNNFPEGGFYRFRQAETLPVWLRRAGYRTIHIGKYLNEIGERAPHNVIPKGWDDWHGGVDPTTYDYFGYTLNHNGRLQTYGRRAADYSTDVYAGIAEQAIRRAHRAGGPFFLSVAPNAPHTVATSVNARVEGTPAVPPPRYARRYANARLPDYPNLNEADISDKPASLQSFFPNQLSRAELADLTQHYRGRMGALLGVDDLVQRVVRQLKASGEYRNTVIVFTSDNGWIMGEHRLRDPLTSDGHAAGVKYVPYEGSTRVPLMIAGPGFPAGRRVAGVSVNADLAPTILDVTGARAGLRMDGISLRRAARDPARLDGRGVLIETFANPRGVPPYKAIRTARYRYELSDGGEEGLYDLRLDRWELRNAAADPRYERIKAILAAKLRALGTCAGRGCRVNVGVLPEPGS